MSNMLRKSARKRKMSSRLEVPTTAPTSTTSRNTRRSQRTYESMADYMSSSNSANVQTATHDSMVQLSTNPSQTQVLATNFPIPVVTTVLPTQYQLPAQSTFSDVSTQQQQSTNIAAPSVTQGLMQTTPVNLGNNTLVVPSTYMYTPNPTVGVASELTVNVSSIIKEKIHKGEYIDLAVLLADNQSINDLDQSLVIQNGQLVMKTKQHTQKIYTIETWTNAFIVYISIYIEVHPGQIQHLLKYMSMIRLGASRTTGIGWKVYDEQFRLRKSVNPNISWSSVDQELWLIYLHNTKPSYTQFGVADQTSTVRPNTYKCYAFNYNGACHKMTCTFKHACTYCNGGHPVINCAIKPTQSQQVRKNFNDLNRFSRPRYDSNGSRFRNPRSFQQLNLSFRSPRVYRQ